MPLPLATILSTGRDANLLTTRNEVLKSKGYAVVAAITPSEIVNSFFDGDFDLVIVCHSIPAEERRKIVRLVRNHAPSTPVVVLSAHEAQPAEEGAIRVRTEPEAILAAISSATRSSLEGSTMAHLE